MPRRNQEFQTIRSEGGLLPPDLLRRVLDPKEGLDGTRPENYGLPNGERLNEVITQSWNRLRKHWAELRSAAEHLPETEPGTGLTNDKWSLPLLRELGFGLLPTTAGPEIGGRTYAINRFFGPVPIHLVGCGLSLDRRSAGVRGAAAANPHGLVQEFINRSPGHLWAIVSNGLRMRLLRKNQALSRQSFLEFDLEAMFAGELYSDFVLLWLMAHATRFAPQEGENPKSCWLERWTDLAEEQGTRALGELRGGVEKALQILGEGFTSHPKNIALRHGLRTGQVSLADFHGQLLRIVYRLIFLFVAEDRTLDGLPLLHPRDGSDTARTARERFALHYGTARLREMAAKIKGSRHGDLWRQFQIIVGALSGEATFTSTREALALPTLGSFLWDLASTAALDDAELTNHDFLEALRHLAFTRQNSALRPVDYMNLGAEELGGVYESLLALTPQINADGARFTFAEFAGNERKTSGSYYTPDSLVQCLLNSALDPVIEETIRGKSGLEAEKAILAIKVCDPAVGSGHFLVGAAHRLAPHLARVRSVAQGESEPSALLYQHALRDVIGHCLYGVDVNPMAAELCRVSLWLEALEPGKPLSFLDHHIQCGNSLVGVTPVLLTKGIPDEALTPIEGDDKEICKEFKRINRDERNRQMRLFAATTEPWQQLGNLSISLANLEAVADDSLEGVREKQRLYDQTIRSADYLSARFWADAWCAAFFWKKTREFNYPITEEVFRRIEHNPHAVDRWMRDEIWRLASDYQFFHWHLAFPDVFKVPSSGDSPENEQTGWSGGFDCVLGNPPWDTLSPDAKEFFSTYDPQVRFTDRDGQQQIIDDLLLNPTIAQRWEANCRDLYALVHFVRQSGRYQMFAPGNLGKGDFNIYRMFVEAALSLTRRNGWAAQIVPEGLYNGANCMAIRRALFETSRLERLIGFENTNGVWFPEVHTAMKFCLYAAQIGRQTDSFRTAFNIHSLEQLVVVKEEPSLNMPVRLVKDFSPDALAIMELDNQIEIEIASKMYRWPAFGDESAGLRRRVYMAEVHMGNDRELFDGGPTGIPLYEGRMVDQFDHRAKGYRSGRGRAAVWEGLPFGSPTKSIQPQWYIPREKIPEKCVNRMLRYRLGFCNVASPTNERTLVASLIPPGCLCGDSVTTIVFEPDSERWQYPLWLALTNSYVMDFIARTKVALHMTFSVLDSLPFPRLERNDLRAQELTFRCLRLSCTGSEMIPFWNQMAEEGWVPATASASAAPGEMDEEVRLQIRAEIDAIVARDVFTLSRPELEYVLTKFPTQQRYQEERYGEFRSRRLILEVFDQVHE